MYQFYFEKLRVWQSARELNKNIYQLTAKFSPNEKYNLTNQIRRASVSVTCNLAEGNSRRTMPDRSRFIHIAHGSLMEVLNLAILAKDLNYITQQDLRSVRNQIQAI
jgi:four helix bundle protein